MKYKPAPVERKSLERKDHQALRLQFKLDRLGRHDAESQAGLNRLFDRFVGAQLAAGSVGDIVLGEVALHGRTRAGSGLAQHQRLVGQSREADWT